MAHKLEPEYREIFYRTFWDTPGQAAEARYAACAAVLAADRAKRERPQLILDDWLVIQDMTKSLVADTVRRAINNQLWRRTQPAAEPECSSATVPNDSSSRTPSDTRLYAWPDINKSLWAVLIDLRQLSLTQVKEIVGNVHARLNQTKCPTCGSQMARVSYKQDDGERKECGWACLSCDGYVADKRE
jgi:hypothetical protein